MKQNHSKQLNGKETLLSKTATTTIITMKMCFVWAPIVFCPGIATQYIFLLFSISFVTHSQTQKKVENKNRAAPKERRKEAKLNYSQQKQ